MAGELLLDTGALVSLLDRSQKQHSDFVRFFDSWTGSVVASEAVLTEATHLLGHIASGRKTCIDFFLAGGAVLVPSTLASLRRSRELIEKYEDLPMDFADATLVVLAEELGTNRVFTTDHQDFSRYRILGRGHFVIEPPQVT